MNPKSTACLPFLLIRKVILQSLVVLPKLLRVYALYVLLCCVSFDHSSATAIWKWGHSRIDDFEWIIIFCTFFGIGEEWQLIVIFATKSWNWDTILDILVAEHSQNKAKQNK